MRFPVFHRVVMSVVVSGVAVFASPPATAQPHPEPRVNPVIVADPPQLTLTGSDAGGQLVVTLQTESATSGPQPASAAVQVQVRERDVTRTVQYVSSDPRVATVTNSGFVQARGNGTTVISVQHPEDRGRASDSDSQKVTVTVRDYEDARPMDFPGDVMPILTRFGCNAGGCHGKANGQNGFKLSLLGFDPLLDHDAIVHEARGRRVFPAAPEESLLLRKATGQTTHGGGKRLEPESPEYRTLVRWVRRGMPYGDGTRTAAQKLEVRPSGRVMARNGTQQLRVVAIDHQGHETDVTPLAQFQSNAADLAGVSETGLVSSLDAVGIAAVMARYDGAVAVARLMIPMGTPVPSWTPPVSDNLVDKYVFPNLQRLGLAPSPACDDGEFARRSALDLTGALPDPELLAAFLADRDPKKREHWLDRLILSPQNADFFALKWSAILRNKRSQGQASQEGSFAFHGWIRHAMASNMPYDQFVGAIVGASGDQRRNPPVAWYRQVTSMEERVDDTAQLFLGTRIQCARCHHHPYERWGQNDYYGFASFFTRMRDKNNDANTPRIAASENGMARNPATGKDVPPTALGGAPLTHLGPRDDPRQSLVSWMREPGNAFVAPTVVNRYWKHFFGRGLVEPEDDIRVTNPASNPELLDALTEDFVAHKFDLKHLIRTLVTSKTYERSSLPTPANAADRQSYARYYPKRLTAEVLLDAIGAATGAAEQFNGVPKEFRAVQLPDDGFNSNFLDAFGRPKRESVCECERIPEANLSQTLLLLNSDLIQQKLAGSQSRAALLARDPRSDDDKITEIYRICLSRDPRASERTACKEYLQSHRTAFVGKDPAPAVQRAFEDILWSLINTKEFLFVN